MLVYLYFETVIGVSKCQFVWIEAHFWMASFNYDSILLFFFLYCLFIEHPFLCFFLIYDFNKTLSLIYYKEYTLSPKVGGIHENQFNNQYDNE